MIRVVALLAIAALPVAFSFVVDPTRLFSLGGEENDIAHVLASGKHVVNFLNYNDRLIERYLAGLRPHRADVMVLGSSRIQMLPASVFSDPVVVNAAMSGGTLDDVLAVYALYDVDARRPRRVVIAVDPWSETYSVPMWWRALIVPRGKLLQRLGVPASPWKEMLTRNKTLLTQLASPEYFRLSLYTLRHHGLRRAEWVATTREQNVQMTKLSNGGVVWPAISVDSSSKARTRYLQRGLQSDARFQRLNELRKSQPDVLERFVRYLRREGVAVTLVLVPYPPEVFAALSALDGHPVQEVETSLRSMAAQTGARLIGGYDPAPFGLTGHDYFDESHLRPEPLARFVREAR